MRRVLRRTGERVVKVTHSDKSETEEVVGRNQSLQRSGLLGNKTVRIKESGQAKQNLYVTLETLTLSFGCI